MTGKGVALMMIIVLTGACSLLPESATERIASEEATPTPIPTAIVPTKPTYNVKRGEIVKELTFSARISPILEEELFFRVNGRVQSVFFKRNDFVKAGDLLAKFEIDDLEREAISANLDLERAQVRLDAALRELGYNLQVADSNLQIAQMELDQLRKKTPPDPGEIAIKEQRVAQAQIAVDRLSHGVDPLLENDVSRAQLNVQKLESAINDAQIVAPFDGKILSISLVSGQAIDGYKNVVVLADVDNLEISADLLSNQMDELQEGMVANAVLVSRPGEQLVGTIRRLPFPYGSGGRSNTEVEEPDKSTRITLDEFPDEGFELGDLVRVTVELERKDNVLWVPPQAIRVFDGRRFAVLKEGDAQRRVDVKVGIQTQDRVEIEEGLEEGQVLIGQ